VARPRAVLFDVDGTLISTGGAGARSWRHAFQVLHGIPADIGKFTDAGMTDPVVARLTFEAAVGRTPTPTELATVMAAYLDRLPHEIDNSEGYRVLDGAAELLPRLGQSEGLLLGITSGGTEAGAHIKLSRAGFNRYFPFGGYGSDSPDRVELTRRAIERGGMLLGETLDPADVFVVGDTPRDVEAAHGAGCVAVATATGHFSREQLEATGAEHVLDSLRDPFPEID
jgi:phosphoglycolate phosphatase-like HAD superfamily hydrolase